MCAGAFGLFIKLMGVLDACMHHDSTDMIPGSDGMTDMTLLWPSETRLIKPGIRRSIRAISHTGLHSPSTCCYWSFTSFLKNSLTLETRAGFCMILQKKILTLEVYFMLHYEADCSLGHWFWSQWQGFFCLVFFGHQNSWVCWPPLIRNQDHCRWIPTSSSRVEGFSSSVEECSPIQS